MKLAIDIGGTKTLIALFSERGRVVRRHKFKTAHNSRIFVQELSENLVVFTKYKVDSVVVAIPGIVQKNYSVHFGNRDWDDIDLYTPIKKVFDCPIYFENDASLAALYESHGTRGRVIFLTFSTGIGGGIVENGKITEDSSNFEPGHKIYEYGGCKLEWEDIAAASALEKFYHVDMATDLRKKAIMKDVAARVALGLTDIVKEYHPNVIVLGGPLGKIFRRYVKYLPDLEVKLKRPKRPLESVIYGCFLYAKRVR